MTPTNETRALTAQLAELLRRERSCLADFLVALAGFDRERRWRELGYASLFDFLHRELGLSKGSTFYRSTAAKLIQQFPEVIEPLRDGRLCFTSVIELAKVITTENHVDVLPRFFHASRREAKALAAEISPVEAPPRRVMVTALPAPRPSQGLAPAEVDIPLAEAGAAAPVTPVAESHPVQPVELGSVERSMRSPAPRDEIVPLTTDLRRLHATVSKRFLKKLEAARAALSHANPGASVEDVLEAGLDLILARDAKRKGLVEKPRRPREGPPADPGRFPAAERRKAWERDAGRCQWILDSGEVCGSTHQVELDHRKARGKGGKGKASNGRLLCRFHNALAAREAYGDAHMDRFTRRARPGPCQDALPGT